MAEFDPRLEVLRAALSTAEASWSDRADSDRPDPHGSDSDRPDPGSARMEAAVALVIRGGAQLDFLLIKRATSERDPWSGQMALPGGRWEESDTGLLHTARRETREETGVNLEVVGRPLGRLVDVVPSSPRLPPMRIAPFVFGVPEGTQAEVTSAELESVHWVSLDLLRAPETSTDVHIDFPDLSKRFPSYHVVGEHVWGLTHGILTGFMAIYGHTERGA
jgi:8-oxo-dGTP pyrophosphatase MutT (NUDIX family)